MFFLVCFISYPVKAGVITNSTQKKQLFAVPGGGWSTITVEVHYNENYTASGSNNKFTGRSKTVFFNRANTTSVTYSAATSNTGTLSFMLSCSGGMPASSADSVKFEYKVGGGVI